MWRQFRLAVLCLVALALPLQGVMAATMLACGLGQHDQVVAHAIEQEHHSTLASVPSHKHLATATSHGDAVDHHTHDASTGDHSAGHKCSVCASCCTSAAAPAETVSFDPVVMTDFFAPPVARSVPAYVTEGLERPPRLFLG